MKKKNSDRKGDAGDDGVGYGKPPKHSRFERGRSGNPKGRPKGTNNLKTDLIEELGEPIRVREGDTAQKVSKQRAMVKSLMARSLKGDTKAASLLLSMMMRLIDTGEGVADAAEPLNTDEQEILHAYQARLRRAADASAEPNGADQGAAGDES